MRKQNHKPVVNEFAIKINELIKKFVEKVERVFQLMIKEELIEKTRKYFGLDTKKPTVRKLADKPVKRKKKQAVRTSKTLSKPEKSVVWETIKPARLTKPRRTKKRAVVPTEPLVVAQVEPIIVKQEVIEQEVAEQDVVEQTAPAVVEEAKPELPPVEETPKLDRKVRLEQLKQLARLNEAKQKAIRVKNLIEGGRRDKNGKKRHLPHIILKKKEDRTEQPIKEVITPTLVVNFTKTNPE